MKETKGARPVFQGDIMLIRCDALPGTAVKLETDVVAHSETGHHHVAVGAEVYTLATDPMVMFLRLPDKSATIEHRRSFDTHETLKLLADEPGSVWQIRRQREHTPEGWRIVAD